MSTDQRNLQFFFHLSGIHSELPSIEIKSILESEKHPFTQLEKKKQCLVLDIAKKGALTAAHRAAYCHRVVELISTIQGFKLTLENIVKYLEERIDFNEHLKKNQSYQVRAYRVSGASKKIISIDLERKLGNVIWKQTNGKNKANMTDPDIVFVMLFTEDIAFFGKEIYSREKGLFEARRPDIRPFFKPGTLDPRFARMMVNLAQASPGEILYDPFCGPGGILIEGALINCSVIGSDLDKRMLIGAKKNIQHYTPNADCEFFIADAKNLPLHNSIRSIATDPPYGRSTSTYGKMITELLSKFFEESYNILKPQGIISIGMFEEIPLKSIAEDSGFQLDYLENLYIHKSLTRTVGVCRKK